MYLKEKRKNDNFKKKTMPCGFRCYLFSGIIPSILVMTNLGIAQNDTLMDLRKEEMALSVSLGINFNKSGGVNGDMQLYLVEDIWTSTYGIDIFYIWDEDGSFDQYYTLNVGIGPNVNFDKIKLFFLFGGSLGVKRSKWYPDKPSPNAEKGITGSVLAYGYTYKGAVYYRLTDALYAGLGIDMNAYTNLGIDINAADLRYDNFFCTGLQLSLQYSFNN